MTCDETIKLNRFKNLKRVLHHRKNCFKDQFSFMVQLLNPKQKMAKFPYGSCMEIYVTSASFSGKFKGNGNSHFPFGKLWEICPFHKSFPNKNVVKFHQFSVRQIVDKIYLETCFFLLMSDVANNYCSYNLGVIAFQTPGFFGPSGTQAAIIIIIYLFCR